MNTTFRHPIEVRFRDCDSLGHVNNAVYFSYLEQARLVYAQQQEFDRAAGDIGFILARAECDFRSQAAFGDLLEVRLGVRSVGRSSFTYEFEIVDAKEGRLVATARSVQVTYDYAEGRSVPLPALLRSKLEAAAQAEQP